MSSAHKSVLRTLAIAAAIGASGIGIATAGTIDKLRQDKTLRIAVRDDAPPFSFKGANGEPAGFMVDLCRSVSRHLATQLNLGDLKIA
jgi:ABC-type amino acid transport substrate-binding protein